MNTVNDCISAMLSTNRELYTRCINEPVFAKAFADIVRIAGEREEFLVGAQQWLMLDARTDEAREHLRRLVARHVGG